MHAGSGKWETTIKQWSSWSFMLLSAFPDRHAFEGVHKRLKLAYQTLISKNLIMCNACQLFNRAYIYLGGFLHGAPKT